MRHNPPHIHNTPLYNVPLGTWILVGGTPDEPPTRIYFDHPDGMYSYCKTEQGIIMHIGMAQRVTIDDIQGNSPSSVG